MTKTSLPNLPDGTDIQTSAAIVAFSDGSQTFRGPIRPNPARRINIRNQAQLEAELGTDLEIADNERLSIALDDAFTLDKPFKPGLNVALEIFGSTNSATLSYTGPGALFQNTNPTNLVTDLNLRNLFLQGDGTNSVFDIIGSTIVQSSNVIFAGFDSLGTIDVGFILFDSVSFQVNTKGLILRNATNISVTRSSVVQIADTVITAFTILPNPGVAVNVDINFARGLAFFPGNSLVFFDPNSPAGSIYTIEKSSVIAGDLYQQGTDIGIDSVTDGTPNAEFNTAAAHGLVVGTPVVLSGFATSAYNGTFIVTAVDTPLTGTQFETGVAFDIDESIGSMNKSSLDSTDPIVFATGNNGTLDSTTIAESSINGTLEVIGNVGVEEPIVDITPVAGNWVKDPATERFSVDNTTGIVTYNGVDTITAFITYSLSATQTSGGTQQILDIDLHINGIVQPKTRITFTTAGVGNFTAIVYNGGNFVINPGDTFQLFKTSNQSTNTDVKETTLLINED